MYAPGALNYYYSRVLILETRVFKLDTCVLILEIRDSIAHNTPVHNTPAHNTPVCDRNDVAKIKQRRRVLSTSHLFQPKSRVSSLE